MKVGGVILAAGRSSRMGRSKAHIRIENEPALARLVRVLNASSIDPIAIVASGDALISAWGMRSCAVLEGDPDVQMIESIARGLTGIGIVDAALIQPVDAPFTTPEMIEALVGGFSGLSRVLTHGGIPGHPVLLASTLFPAVAARPAGGLRALLSPERFEAVPFADPRVLADLDTPEDLARWTETL